MRIYLAQHAESLSKQQDPERPLSDKGRRDAAKVAELLKPLDLCVQASWHSGKARAKETAEILAAAIPAGQGPAAREDLSPNDDVGPLAEELQQVDQDQMVVGHLPFLAKLASRLLTGREEPPVIAFRQGGVVCLERGPEGHWQVAWAVTPDLAR